MVLKGLSFPSNNFCFFNVVRSGVNLCSIKKPMKVKVNRTELIIFSGARVADAVRQYYVKHKKAIPEEFPPVEDQYGNSVAPDGRLRENSHLIIKKQKK